MRPSFPGALARLTNGEATELKIDVEGALPDEEFIVSFNPKSFCGETAPKLKRPKFLGIVASATLAMTLAKKSSGHVDGFVVEGETAGGHNAPPRGPLQLSPIGEPIYGPRDVADLKKIAELGLPFWLAGSYGRPGGLARALALGGTGIQVGTAFAFCEESGIDSDLKNQVFALSRAGAAKVFTDPLASPTGFPFKVAQIPGTLSQAEESNKRFRICDLGYLRHLYRKPDGSIGYRCPSEPVGDYLLKGGVAEDTLGRKCVCNGLPSTVGMGQVRSDGKIELPLVTAGDNLASVAEFLEPGANSYTAARVIAILLSKE